MDARSWKAATTSTCPNYLPDAVSNNKMFVALQGCTIVLSCRCYAVITPPMNARISLSASRAVDEPAIRRPTQTISIKTPGGEEHGLCWVSFWSRASSHMKLKVLLLHAFMQPTAWVLPHLLTCHIHRYNKQEISLSDPQTPGLKSATAARTAPCPGRRRPSVDCDRRLSGY